MTTTNAPLPDITPTGKRPIKEVVLSVRELFKRHVLSGNELLAAFAHPEITDEQIVAMARAYGASRRGLRESLRLLDQSPKIRASFTLSALVASMQWPKTD
jgi:hypothetical protein